MLMNWLVKILSSAVIHRAPFGSMAGESFPLPDPLVSHNITQVGKDTLKKLMDAVDNGSTYDLNINGDGIEHI